MLNADLEAGAFNAQSFVLILYSHQTDAYDSIRTGNISITFTLLLQNAYTFPA